ncbi:MAG: hypothetical protein EON92_03295 [Burkholderiales bacterium]|nr:MAG: hypothetical protein EON92_03295 [Burkholderiales bacterium]
MTLTPGTLLDNLSAAFSGRGIPPEACEELIARGWAIWVDYETGLPIDLNDPRSLLLITAAGRRQVESMSVSAGVPHAAPSKH